MSVCEYGGYAMYGDVCVDGKELVHDEIVLTLGHLLIAWAK